MIAEFSIMPVGKGAHLSKYIAPIIALIQESGLAYKMGPMGTCVEGSADEVFALIKACHEKMADDSQRVITTIKIDDFKERTDRLTSKIKAVEEHLGREVEK